jgi:hypothetical protein
MSRRSCFISVCRISAWRGHRAQDPTVCHYPRRWLQSVSTNLETSAGILERSPAFRLVATSLDGGVEDRAHHGSSRIAPADLPLSNAACAAAASEREKTFQVAGLMIPVVTALNTASAR